ncbi:hypothetical protein D3C85_1733980 [compost metagenome]
MDKSTTKYELRQYFHQEPIMYGMANHDLRHLHDPYPLYGGAVQCIKVRSNKSWRVYGLDQLIFCA